MNPGEQSSSGPSLDVRSNSYKAKRPWPPNFDNMDPKHQFRLERRYRRRSKLAYTRPGWIRGVKLVQYSSILFVVGYTTLCMDWGTMGNPFGGVRTWLKEKGNSVWSFGEQPQQQRLNRISSQSSESD